METVSIRFTLTPKTLFQGHWVFYSRRTLIVGLVVLGMSAFSVATNWRTKDLPLTLAVWTVAWILLGLRYVLGPWLHYRAWVKEPNVGGPCELTVDGDSIKATSNQMKSVYEWSIVTRSAESAGLFVLRIGKKQMMVIPKSSFESEDDLARFRRILASKIAVVR